MNKVINGKRYDTETAEWLGKLPAEGIYAEVNFYRKRTGEYFKSKWSEFASAKDIIEPLDECEAYCYAEEYLTGDEVDRLFGATPE